MASKVYLVGAGPGSADLITVRGRNILRQAEVVIYDYLVDRRILEEAPQDAELICCDKLGKKRYANSFSLHQERINDVIVKKVKAGKRVVRLKSGDPGIFSRTSSELDVLVKNKIAFEIVPGVTAATAASCLSGIPLTDRRLASSCIFVTGRQDPAKKKSSLDWKGISKSGTIVLYMAVDNLGKIAQSLVNAGKPKDTPVAVIKDASLPTQKMITGLLGNIVQRARQYKITAPAIIIIGAVVKFERKFNWLKKVKRVFFTGISPESFFNKELVFHLPLIRIVALGDYCRMDALLKGIGNYAWLVFTSRYGAEYFFWRLNKIGYDTRRLKVAKIAAIGQSTKKRLLEFGVLADLVPKEESSQGLINAFKNYNLEGKRIFMPRSDLSDKGLVKGLKAQGARVTPCVAYKNIMPDTLPDLDLGFFDEIMFTSPSTVKNFKARYKKIPAGVKIRCIGKVTQEQAVREGFKGV